MKNLKMLLMAIVFSIVSLGVSPIQADLNEETAIAGHDWNKVRRQQQLKRQRDHQRRQRQMRENNRRRHQRNQNRKQTRQLGKDLHHAGHHSGCFITTASE